MTRDEFLCGFALAVAGLIRIGFPSQARDLCTMNGFTSKDFRTGGVEEYDLAEIRRVLKH